MPTIQIDDKTLRNLCKANCYEIPKADLVFVGLRGTIVPDPADQSFKLKHQLSTIDINYINPRCTILQWRRADKKVAAFPASTVPNQKYTKAALAGGDATNCLMPGYYDDYRKGVHLAGSVAAHAAFRQNLGHPYRRSYNDLDYDKDDRIEYSNPNDNIHCGWFGSLNATDFGSAGCQVIMGYPKSASRPDNLGPWKVFHDNAYTIKQDAFPYVLATGLDVLAASTAGGVTKARLRYGASGKLVEKLQKVLKGLDYYEGNIDGDFGERTLKAVIAYQTKQFGASGADGIVGPMTGEALKVDLRLSNS
jgi:hypothetical protein